MTFTSTREEAMFHFCNDELQVLLATIQSLPYLGQLRAVAWIRSRLERSHRSHYCERSHLSRDEVDREYEKGSRWQHTD